MGSNPTLSVAVPEPAAGCAGSGRPIPSPPEMTTRTPLLDETAIARALTRMGSEIVRIVAERDAARDLPLGKRDVNPT